MPIEARMRIPALKVPEYDDSIRSSVAVSVNKKSIITVTLHEQDKEIKIPAGLTKFELVNILACEIELAYRDGTIDGIEAAERSQ